MTEKPREDQRIEALGLDGQRRLYEEDLQGLQRRLQQQSSVADEVHQALLALAEQVNRFEAENVPDPENKGRFFHLHLDAEDAYADAKYQRRSYLFLGMSVLALTVFVGYGARDLLLQSLTVALLLIISALAGVWAIFLASEKYKRGMLVADHISQIAAIEQEAQKQAAVGSSGSAAKRNYSRASRSPNSGASKVIREHPGRTSRAEK